MKKVGIGLLVVVLIIVMFVAMVGLEVFGYKVGGFLGKERAKMTGEINTEVVSQEDKVFKESTQYIDNQINQLAKIKLEMMKTDNEGIKKALAEEVQESFSSFDASKIPNQSLRSWFLNVLDGIY